jgi:hypothetical protein
MLDSMNVTADQLCAYIAEFHSTLDTIAARFFSKELAKNLMHVSLLPAKITCYASTQNGVAFEYSPASTLSIIGVRGTQLIEDLVIQAPNKLRNVGPLFGAHFPDLTIGGMTIEGAFPFRLPAGDSKAKLYDVRLSAKQLNWSREFDYVEFYSNRLATHWSTEAAHSRAKDEVLAALFMERSAETKGVDLHDYFSKFWRKTVLLLGAYDSDGSERLRRIASALTQLGYEPLLIKDVPDFETYDISQKVVAVGSVCRFIVMDDSMPSGHLSEFEIIRSNRWVSAILRAGGRGASWMTAGASIASNVMHEGPYDPADVLPAVTAAVQWAEERLKGLKDSYGNLYPWRMKP